MGATVTMALRYVVAAVLLSCLRVSARKDVENKHSSNRLGPSSIYENDVIYQPQQVSNAQSGSVDLTENIEESIDYGFIMTFSPESACFDFDSWCRTAVSEALSATPNLETDNFVYAWLNAHSLCYIAKDVLNESTAVVVATGSLNITYNGEEQAVNSLNLIASTNHATMAIADSMESENPKVNASNYTIVYTNETELCSLLGNNDTWSRYLCGESTAGSEILGAATADGLSTGSAAGRAGHVQNANSIVSVEGVKIKKFSTTMTIAAEGFVFADTKAAIEAISQAYLLAYATSYTETCFRFVESMCESTCALVYSFDTYMQQLCTQQYCVSQRCEKDEAYQPVNSTAFGESFGESIGEAFDRTAIQFSTVLNYEHDRNVAISDRVTFGYEGQGISTASAVFECIDTNVMSGNKNVQEQLANLRQPSWWQRRNRRSI